MMMMMIRTHEQMSNDFIIWFKITSLVFVYKSKKTDSSIVLLGSNSELSRDIISYFLIDTSNVK